MAISVSYAQKTDKTVVLLSTMHNKEEINTDSEKKKPLVTVWWFWTTAPPRVQWIPLTWWSSPTCAQGQPDDDQWDFSSSLWMLSVCMLPLFGGNTKSRRNDVHSCLPLPTTWWSQWLTTGRSQPTSDIMSSVSRAMLAIGRFPITSRIDVWGNGQQDTWSMPELPAISGTELTEGQNVSSLCMASTKESHCVQYNCVVCPLRLQSDTRDDEWTRNTWSCMLLLFVNSVVV